MIGSRAFCLLRHASRSPLINKNVQQRWMSSEGEWQYRGLPNPPKWAQRGATISAVMVYWWFYWNLWHGWGHLIGMFDGEFLPNPRNFTDEELGIPPEHVIVPRK